jgi:uncharacterized protein (DUF427 family)
VDGEVNRAAARYYPDPSPAGAGIAGRIAFWRDVRVVADDHESEGSRRGLLVRLLGR